MIVKLLIAGAAIGALAAGGATAKVRHHHQHAMSRGMTGVGYTYAEPAAPIPYSDIDHYLHASRAERRSMETAAASPSAMTAAEPAAAETPASAGPEPAAPSSMESQPSTAMPATQTPPAPPK